MIENINIQIGYNLRRLRLTSGQSQNDIASLLGISYQQVQKQETGANRISLESLLKIKEHYGISYDDLFGHIPTKPARIKLPNDEIALKIGHKISKIDDIETKRKIQKIVNILAA